MARDGLVLPELAGCIRVPDARHRDPVQGVRGRSSCCYRKYGELLDYVVFADWIFFGATAATLFVYRDDSLWQGGDNCIPRAAVPVERRPVRPRRRLRDRRRCRVESVQRAARRRAARDRSSCLCMVAVTPRTGDNAINPEPTMNRPTSTLLCALSLIAVAPSAHAQQSIDPQRLDSVSRYVESEMQRLHIPGMSVAILRGDSIVMARGYGYANVESPRPGDRQHHLSIRLGREAVHVGGDHAARRAWKAFAR